MHVLLYFNVISCEHHGCNVFLIRPRLELLRNNWRQCARWSRPNVLEECRRIPFYTVPIVSAGPYCFRICLRINIFSVPLLFTVPEVRRVRQRRPEQLPSVGELQPVPAVHVPPATLAVPAGVQQLAWRDHVLQVRICVLYREHFNWINEWMKIIHFAFVKKKEITKSGLETLMYRFVWSIA